MNEKIDFMKDIIYTNRKKKNLTQEQLAEMLNVSNKTISKWERGIGYPDVKIIPTLAKVLDISIQTLFDSEDLKPESNIWHTLEKMSKYKRYMILSVFIFLISPLFYLIFAFIIEDYGMIGISIGILLIIVSIFIAIMESIKIYQILSKTRRNEKYICSFKKYILFYSFLVFIPSIFATALFKKNIFIIIMSTLVYILFELLSFFIIKTLNVNIKNKIQIIFLSIACLLFIAGLLLMLLMPYPAPYIMLYIASSLVSYITLFLSKDIVNN